MTALAFAILTGAFLFALYLFVASILILIVINVDRVNDPNHIKKDIIFGLQWPLHATRAIKKILAA